MDKVLLVALGGAAGSVLRYALSGLAQAAAPRSVFPYGTLAVNVAGSFLAGLLWGLFENRLISPQARVFLFAGLLGGFTTFSAFALESMHLLRDGELASACANMAATNMAGLAAAFAGYLLARSITRPA